MRHERVQRQRRRCITVGTVVLAAVLATGSNPLRGQDEVNEEERAAVARARAALALELETPEKDIAEEGVSFARFPNSALGCPRPGEMSATVITPGWRVIFQVGDDRYDVRVSEDGRLVRVCGTVGTTTKARPSAAVQQDLRAATRAATTAQRDLAGRLGVAESQVRRVWARPVRWPDEPADCSAPEPAETGSGVTGFLVLLEHDGGEYPYRVDPEGALPCGDEYGGDGR